MSLPFVRGKIATLEQVQHVNRRQLSDSDHHLMTIGEGPNGRYHLASVVSFQKIDFRRSNDPGLAYRLFQFRLGHEFADLGQAVPREEQQQVVEIVIGMIILCL